MRIQCVSGVSYAPKKRNIYNNNQAHACQNMASIPNFGFWQPAMETKLKHEPVYRTYVQTIGTKPKDPNKSAEIYMANLNVTKDYKPKDGIWLKGRIASEVDTSTLDSYRRKYINVHDDDMKVLRTICSKNKGEVVYKQDEYANGKLVTYIITRTADGRKETRKIEEMLDNE